MVLCEHLHLNVQELAPVEILECNIKLSGVNLRKCWPGVTLGLVEVSQVPSTPTYLLSLGHEYYGPDSPTCVSPVHFPPLPSRMPPSNGTIMG